LDGFILMTAAWKCYSKSQDSIKPIP